MSDQYLLRDQAPLTSEQWSQIDRVVSDTARRLLVGRRIMPIYGPLGPGLLAVQVTNLAPPRDAAINLTGQESAMIVTTGQAFVPIPLIYRDFTLNWRNLEQSAQLGVPLDLGQVAAAAMAVARMEDDLIFNGRPELGYVGLRNADGRITTPLGNWREEGGAFSSIIDGVTKLGALGFPGPFAVVASPGLFAAMNRVFDNTGLLEIEQVRKVAQAGVFLSSVLPEPAALLLSVGAENFDLAVSQDIVAAYLQSTNMNHELRVLEAVALRISRPQAIVTFES